MLLSAHEVYRFKFNDNVSSVNGIYRLLAIANRQEFTSLSGDIQKQFYVYTGLSVEDSEADFDVILTNSTQDRYYKLEFLEEGKPLAKGEVLWIHEGHMKEVPEHNMREYSNLTLMFDLGAFANQEVLEALINSVATVILPTIGIAPEQMLFEYGKTWMSLSDYEAIEEDRDTRREKIKNYKTEVEALLKEKLNLEANVAALTEMVLTQDAQIKELTTEL